ncbi:MAG: M20/M25/M40 family metallo-hydrolase, partial [Holosporales bacterium]|nr:M20/M25/M40 family metallo-hydrolase [Holosporales bacterium]
GHAASPEQALNPIPLLLRYLDKLTHHIWEQKPGDFAPSHLEVTSIDVDNPITNVIPSRAEARANIRFHIQHTSEDIIRQVQTWATEMSSDLSVECVPNGEAFLCQDTRVTHALEKAIQSVMNIMPRYSTGGGTTDGRFVAAHCPVIEFGMVCNTIHHKNERIPVADCDNLTKIYEAFLENYFLEHDTL